MGAYEPISVYGNYFVAVDGEGTVGDEYSLLDSSLDDYPRLYTGSRLTTMECLDWLWGLGKHAGFCQFVLYGARYDFDNWMRDIDPASLDLYVHGHMIRYGPYAIVWQRGYKFEIRRVAKESDDGTILKYDRIRTHKGNGTRERIDRIGLVFWDVLPFWQNKFTQAVADTLGNDASDMDLIEAGKTARGTFTHENIEWVSRYNKAECRLLAQMCVRLDAWFHSVDIKPPAYNGPGAAAKAVLATYEPYEHAGRKLGNGRHNMRDYVFPGWSSDSALVAARSAYAGGRNQLLYMGYRPGTSYSYDINSAYPAAMVDLPCLSHGRWRRTLDFEPERFGLWRIRYRASRALKLYPFFWRQADGSIVYPSNFADKWVYTCELEAGMLVDPDGIAIREGWVWEPSLCDNPYPFWFVRKLSADRLSYKRRGEKGPALGMKLALNSLYGSIAQARGSLSFSTAPWTQQMLWAGWITAYTRAKLYLAAMLDPFGMYHLATDGIICASPIPVDIGSGLGQWEEELRTDLTLVQYGVYFSREKNRWRGFDLSPDPDSITSFVSSIHAAWCSPWRTVGTTQRLFVTSGLVASGQKDYASWCTWEDAPRVLNLDVDTPLETGAVHSLDRLYPVVNNTDYYGLKLPTSTLYEPKWGKGGGFPYEMRDALEDAFDVALV